LSAVSILDFSQQIFQSPHHTGHFVDLVESMYQVKCIHPARFRAIMAECQVDISHRLTELLLAEFTACKTESDILAFMTHSCLPDQIGGFVQRLDTAINSTPIRDLLTKSPQYALFPLLTDRSNENRNTALAITKELFPSLARVSTRASALGSSLHALIFQAFSFVKNLPNLSGYVKRMPDRAFSEKEDFRFVKLFTVVRRALAASRASGAENFDEVLSLFRLFVRAQESWLDYHVLKCIGLLTRFDAALIHAHFAELLDRALALAMVDEGSSPGAIVAKFSRYFAEATPDAVRALAQHLLYGSTRT
jgi:hypothetical protein